MIAYETLCEALHRWNQARANGTPGAYSLAGIPAFGSAPASDLEPPEAPLLVEDAPAWSDIEEVDEAVASLEPVEYPSDAWARVESDGEAAVDELAYGSTQSGERPYVDDALDEDESVAS